MEDVGGLAEDPLEERDVDELRRSFVRQVPVFEDLVVEIEKQMRTALTSVPLKFHSCDGRVKTQDSFLEKVTRKRYRDPFADMHDIVGLRVVCLFLEDLDQVDKLVRANFDVLKHEDKTKASTPDRFGYRSVHYDCRIPAGYSGPHYDHIKGIVFEVQVRTILQDAWAVVEHYLGYKGLNSIPFESQADFGALVGLFHLADKTFQQIKTSAGEHDAAAMMSIANQPTNHDERHKIEQHAKLDRSTLKALLRTIYSDRTESSDADYSEFVEELARSNIFEIERLRQLLKRGREIDVETDRSRSLNAGDGMSIHAQKITSKKDELSDVRLARLDIGLSHPAFRLNRLKKLPMRSSLD